MSGNGNQVNVPDDIWEEFKFVVLSEPIDPVYWMKRFNYPSSSRGNFLAYLKRRGINYLTKHRENLNIKDTEEMLQRYNIGETAITLCKEYRVGIDKLKDIIVSAGLKWRASKDYNILSKMKNNLVGDSQYLNAFKLAEELGLRPFINEEEYKKDGSKIFYLCPRCDKPIYNGIDKIKNKVKKNRTHICVKCFHELKEREVTGAQSRKRVSNTSGYIGISIFKDVIDSIGTTIPSGFKFQIKNRSKNFTKRFKDKTLSDKTLMEAVVYREKYIIENGLPHTRNLSNEDLISNMEMLGQYGDIDLIKKKLG